MTSSRSVGIRRTGETAGQVPGSTRGPDGTLPALTDELPEDWTAAGDGTGESSRKRRLDSYRSSAWFWRAEWVFNTLAGNHGLLERRCGFQGLWSAQVQKRESAMS